METIQLLKYEVIFHWIALFFYLFSTIFFVRHVVFKNEKSLNVGLWLALIGLIPHTIALGIRWYAVGHGPYLQQMESFSSTVWVSMVIFLVCVYKVPRLKSLGFVILPCCLAMMILGIISNPWVSDQLAQTLDHGRLEKGIYARSGVAKVPPTFCGIWFVIHITFTIVAVGAILISLSTAIFYLLKKKKGENEFYNKLPSLEALDAYSYKYAGFGFISWTIMVVSGSLWAEQSWGRYWGWDPIETWSLITLLLFGIYLHLRRFFKWQGEKAAWFIVVCIAFAIATLFIIPFVMTTVHSQYFL
ncbi:MAG TPA: cytochrome c biogenesis protein CcsA [Anaerolineae bacterium]|nr:cytochrome c biogenesis protein CcsA [Anaerolineae bacterium]